MDDRIESIEGIEGIEGIEVLGGIVEEMRRNKRRRKMLSIIQLLPRPSLVTFNGGSFASLGGGEGRFYYV